MTSFIVEVKVKGLGRLQNVVGIPSDKSNINQIPPESHLPDLNLEITAGGVGLTEIGGKQMNIQNIGNGPETAIFVHGLGGTSEYFTPIVKSGEPVRFSPLQCAHVEQLGIIYTAGGRHARSVI